MTLQLLLKRFQSFKMNKTSIFKATVIVSVLVIICKFLGFAREAIIAAYYGASAQTDAFFFAQGMPASIFPSICNSISTAFTAIYVKKKLEDEEAGCRYASSMIITTSLIGVVLSALGVLIAPWLVPVFAPGFKDAQLSLAVHLTKLIMGAFFLTMLQYMLSAVLNSNKIFYAAQFANMANNIVIIVLTVILGKQKDMDLLTVSVIFGLIMNVLILVFCSKKMVRFNQKLQPFGIDARDLLKLSFPIIIGNGAVQINTIVDKALGSKLAEGSLSALTYSGTLNAMVIGVFITSLSTVLYPTLTEAASSGDMDEFGNKTVKSLGSLSLVLTFISFFTFINAREIVEVVFARGEFDKYAVIITTAVLEAYAFLYVFTGIREVLTRTFFSIQDTKTPMINSAVGVGINIVLSIILVKYMGIVGIALATVISNIIISLLLMASTKRRIKSLRIWGFIVSIIKQFGAGIVMTIGLIALDRMLSVNNSLLLLVTNTIIGLFIYTSILRILKCDDYLTIEQSLLIRIKRM